MCFYQARVFKTLNNQEYKMSEKPDPNIGIFLTEKQKKFVNSLPKFKNSMRNILEETEEDKTDNQKMQSTPSNGATD